VAAGLSRQLSQAPRTKRSLSIAAMVLRSNAQSLDCSEGRRFV
jgi:hypothetical protein